MRYLKIFAKSGSFFCLNIIAGRIIPETDERLCIRNTFKLPFGICPEMHLELPLFFFFFSIVVNLDSGIGVWCGVKRSSQVARPPVPEGF